MLYFKLFIVRLRLVVALARIAYMLYSKLFIVRLRLVVALAGIALHVILKAVHSKIKVGGCPGRNSLYLKLLLINW